MKFLVATLFDFAGGNMTKALFIFIAFFLIFLPSPADAGPDGQGPWYGGPKVGKLLADRPLDTAWNAGVLLGREVWRSKRSSLSVEGEGTFTVIAGDLHGNNATTDWRMNTADLWLAYRADWAVYPVVKLGLGYGWFSIDQSPGDNSNSDVGLGVSLGFGTRLGSNWRVEAEYSPKATVSFANDDISHIRALSLGVYRKF